MIEPNNETIVVEGAGLCLRRVGKGPPVLLTHGVPGDVETLAPVADLLALDAEAITVSLGAVRQTLTGLSCGVEGRFQAATS